MSVWEVLDDTKDVSSKSILRMYQLAGAVPQETIDGSNLGEQGFFYKFFQSEYM